MVENNISFDPAKHYRLGVTRERGMFKVCTYTQGTLPQDVHGLFTTMSDAVRAIDRYYKALEAPPPPPRVKPRPKVKYRKLRKGEVIVKPDKWLLVTKGNPWRAPTGEYIRKPTTDG